LTDYLLHFPAYGLPPVGIWWWSGDSPNSYYAPDEDAMRTVGTASLAGVPSEAAWDYTSQRLAARTPHDGDAFEIQSFPDNVPPAAALRLARTAVPA
jgi:hypothetical protein